MFGRFPCRSQSHRGVSRRRARGRHGRRRASSGAPATVLRVGIGSRGGVEHAGAVCLAETSSPARFGRPEPIAPPCPVFVSLTCGGRLSVREREREQRDLLFSEF